MGHLLLIGVGIMGTPYIRAARRLGLTITLVEREVHRARLEPEVDRFVPCGGRTEEAWAAAAFAAAATAPFDAVLGFAEAQVVAAALVQDEIGAPGPSLGAAVLSRNKALQRGRFAAAGLAQPEFLVSNDLQSAYAWGRIRLPVIVKPVSGSGSSGVLQVGEAGALHALLAERLRHDKVLIETVLPGEEYSWEGLVHNGTVLFSNITAKETTGPPHFVEVAHRGGHLMDRRARAAVSALARGVVQALSMDTGIMHLEFRLTDTGPAIIEVAVRTPGDHIMDVLAATYSFDPFEAVLALALGRSVSPPRRPSAYGASWFPHLPAGRVVRVTGLDDVRRHPYVTIVDLALAPGQNVPACESSAQRLGYILLQAPTRRQLDAAMSQVRTSLAVEVDDGRQVG